MNVRGAHFLNEDEAMKFFQLLFITLFLTACSVHYAPRVPGFVPGYVDTQLGEKTYQVKIGEAWPKDWPDLEKFALYRASEITQEKGLRYFVVKNASTQTTHYTITSPVVSNTSGTASFVGSTAFVNTTTTTRGGVSVPISGGWYILDFKMLKESDLSKYDKVIDSETIMSDLKYFIDSRRPSK